MPRICGFAQAWRIIMRFLDRLRKEMEHGNCMVIPDIKCFSPKEGDLLQGRNPVDIAISLVEAGAPVLSVVTENKKFKGSAELLTSIVKATKVPVLRKDFIHTKEDLVETKEMGASAILLMCSCLSKEEMIYLYHAAITIGLDPFVETHTMEELQLAEELGAKLVGINNRNILELECDDGTVSTTCQIAAYAPKEALLISESSIRNPSEVRSAIWSGADFALVGTAIWQAKNPALYYKMLCAGVSVKICGLQRQEDVKTCMDQGVEILGFVTEYPIHVPWNLTRDQARDLINLVSSDHRTCIVTGGKPSNVICLAYDLKPDIVQLHYHETLEETRIIADKLLEAGIETIKTVPLSEEEQNIQFGTTDMEQIIGHLCQTKVAALLVDAREASNASEAGMTIDIERYKRIRQLSSKKVILAGGINTDNIRDILIQTEAEYIDIMTGVEMTASVKDADKINEIMRTANGFHIQRKGS